MRWDLLNREGFDGASRNLFYKDRPHQFGCGHVLSCAGRPLTNSSYEFSAEHGLFTAPFRADDQASETGGRDRLSRYAHRAVSERDFDDRGNQMIANAQAYAESKTTDAGVQLPN